jgi:hypothetical protein
MEEKGQFRHPHFLLSVHCPLPPRAAMAELDDDEVVREIPVYLSAELAAK